ncbi:hypothetical protein TVAGG3_1075680 [Trichomonas vaginalis G3]|uniref:uncharacterized protein n=1 Tax=Trichomonas vaginalis (strain ATCC PRA-98 / G3) TaxID=412133 RepID=UPI0021E5C700|nr:uncharacterized protein TVAGG3_1075680 [Trichomonas vaginalis G3]KAI5482961.1 hypothetical protein TVAGG3_1075680 [Trichomonas vaginalis G3]
MDKKIEIKGDQIQQVQKLTVETECLENELMNIKSSRTRANQVIQEFKKQLQSVALDVDRKKESQNDRIKYLNHAALKQQKKKKRLNSKLRQLEIEVESQKEKYESQVEAMQYQAHEIETNLKSKIQVALHQLRGLREFQEHKHQMDEQMRNISQLISKERKERLAEQSAIHKKLQAQREYYEKQLSHDLAEADSFATEFQDLHLDLATTKILHETEAKREALKADNNNTLEVIKKNDQLRHQLQDLEQQRRLLTDTEKNLTAQAVDFKSKLNDTAKKVEEAIETSNQKLDALRNRMNNKIAELNERLTNAQQENDNLKRQVSLQEKSLEHAEFIRDEKLRKQQELMYVMNEAAIFILTSLELQEKGPTKDELSQHSSGLNAVIRKLANISQDMSGIEKKSVKSDKDEKADKKMLSRQKTSNTASASESQRTYGQKDSSTQKFVKTQKK